MADVVIGAGASHGPQLSIPPERWSVRAAADLHNDKLSFRGSDYTYQELLRERAAAFRDETALDVKVRRHAVARAAVSELGAAILAAEPDVLVVVSSDHKEIFSDEFLAPFTVYWGETFQHEPLAQEHLDAMPEGVAEAEVANVPETSTTKPGHSSLAQHVIRETVRVGFDVCASNRLPLGAYGNRGIPHGWGFVLQQVLRGVDIPVVPVFVNTFYPPNQPSAARCFDFGVALGAAVRSFPSDIRVGVIASGGLSHFVVDEDLDRDVLAALCDRDHERLKGLPASLLRSGTSEVRNWITVAGALQPPQLSPRVVAYEPCYRTDAGTGCAMAFMLWQ
ncbi:MAG: hypothetical protein JWR62_314 [Modestobacter sp.]|jgi:hypothetical protein|nr:hypothetical protein [Modestobacter sp.]